MGIDYTIYTDTSPRYLKSEWCDIDWHGVFDVLGIDLQRLYDNPINYWSPEQVKDIRDMIQIVCEDPTQFYDNGGPSRFRIQDIEKAKALKGDAEQLLTFFNEYVALGVRIYID